MVNILTFILFLRWDKGQVTYLDVGCESDIFSLQRIRCLNDRGRQVLLELFLYYSQSNNLEYAA